MTTTIKLDSDQELPSTPFHWQDGITKQTVDFSSGWTFRFEISRNGAVVVNKTSGITGAATSPNVLVDWAADEIASLSGVYDVRLIARRTADSKDRVFPQALQLYVNPAPTPLP